jgi:PKD repeat protein
MNTFRLTTLAKGCFLLLLLGLNKISQAQISSTGKLFFMSFMEMETRTGFGGNSNPYPDTLILFVTSEKDTRVSIDNPRLTGSQVNVNITKNVVNRIAVDNIYYYPTGSEFGASDQNSRRGLRLVADDPVNVYCMNLELNRSDGTFILPYESIPAAPEFFVPSFPPNARIGTSSPAVYGESEFVIIGMDNNVKVEITPTQRTKGGKPANTSFTVTLQQGQIYQVQSHAQDGTGSTDPAASSWSTTGARVGDLTGTRIRVVDGCGKINVFSGARSSHVTRSNCGSGVNGRDHLYTQVLPTAALGKDYILMPFARQTFGYAYKVIAAYDTTIVRINGVLADTLKKKGDWIYRNVATDVTANIQTSKPAYVSQYMKNGVCNGWSGSNNTDGDPAIFISPDVNQRLIRTTVGTATTSNMARHWVNILVDRGAKSAVKLNGNMLNPSDARDVNTAFGNYSYFQIQVANPSSNNIECDSGLVVVAYGTGPYESYTYSAGALFESMDYDFSITRKGRCPSEPVTMVAKNSNTSIKGIRWNFGDGSPEVSGDSVIHTFKAVGTYYVVMKAIVPNNCSKDDTVVRSRIINVLPGPIFDFADTTRQCAATLNLEVKAPVSNKYLYTWQDSSKKSSFTVTKDQKIWVRVLDTASNCSAVDSSWVERANVVTAAFIEDSVVRCDQENFFRLKEGSTFNGDFWKSSFWETVKQTTSEYASSDSSVFIIQYDTISSNPLRYIVESLKGCRDTLDTMLVVYPYPIARMALQTSEYCQNAFSTFTDRSTSPRGRFISYWSFSNGKLDTNFSAKTDSFRIFKFDTSGTFGVRLITQTDYGCRDTIDSTFVLNPIAKAIIGTRTLNKCFKNNSFELNDNTQFTGTFGDQWIVEGKTYDNQGTLVTSFKDTGRHIIRLVTITDIGCRDTALANLFVAPEPKAIMKVTDSSLCFRGHFYKLECVSTAPSNATLDTRSNWLFQDGTNAYAKIIPNKTMSAAGKYWVRLIAETTDGCKDSVQRDIVIFEQPDAKITPDFATQCLVGNSFDFKSVNPWNVTGKTVTHTWTLGDGNTSTSAEVVHNYAAMGTYQVRHTMRSQDGCTDTAITEAYVVSTPNVNFLMSKDTACFYSQGFDLINQTNYTGTFTNSWQFSDGSSATSTDVANKQFVTPGVKLVKLVVTTDQGCKDSMTKSLEVFTVPQAQFSTNLKTQCLQNNIFTFVNTSLENGNPGSTYQWTISGKSPASYTGKDIPNQTLIDTGWHDVDLKVTSPKNCVTNVVDKIYVAETPIVSITGRDGCQGEPIQFGNALTLNSGTPTYSWEFGDGRTSNQPSPLHTYTGSGNFTVKLKVTSDKGCVGEAMDFPLAIFVKPTAKFTSEYLLSQGMETDWRFTYTGSGADQVAWVFEDGQTDYGLAPVLKTFSTTGDFKVKMYASTANGCRDSAMSTIFLKPELLMHIPNAFTPNVDGLNEDFGPSSTFGLERYSFKIYDRWGRKTFETTDPLTRWSGLGPDGKPVMEGVYAYELLFRYVDNKLYVFKGTVMVLRP